MIKFDKNIFLLAKSQIYLMGQKYLGYHYLVIYDKLLKHSHWVTQETYTVTQETKTRRYLAELGNIGFFGSISIYIEIESVKINI